MLMYLPLILICHNSIPISECTTERAEQQAVEHKLDQTNITILHGEPKNSPMSCIIEGETRLASLGSAPLGTEPYYHKIKCLPKDIN